MYLEDIPRYRDTMMESICKSENIVNLIQSVDTKLKPRDLPYKRVFPYNYIINKTTEAGIYICFDISIPRVIDRAFNDYRLYFWIIAHERWMKTPKGLSSDIISSEIDKLINGSNCFGLGRVELKESEPFTPAEDFYGRVLTYRTVDFNRE